MMNITAQISFHFKSAWPTLKSKHSLPIEPEICWPKWIRQNIWNLFVLKLFFGCDEKSWKCHCRFFVKLKLFVGVGILTSIDWCTAKRIVRVVFVQPIVFIEHRHARCFYWWHISEHIPHNLKVVVHFSAATHIEAFCYILFAVTATACQFKFFKQVNVLAFHLSVTNKIECCGKSCKSCADNISRFFVNILWLFRMSKCFISSWWIIHNKTS